MVKFLCAVRGCGDQGHQQICFYCGKYHHHGKIHYDCGCPIHSVKFRKDEWYYICDEHYKLLKSEREAWERGAKNEKT